MLNGLRKKYVFDLIKVSFFDVQKMQQDTSILFNNVINVEIVRSNARNLSRMSLYNLQVKNRK